MNVKEIKSENLTYEEVESMDKEYYLNCFGPRLPVVFDHGEGSVLYDIDKSL